MMKFAGEIILILSSTAVGLCLSENIRKKAVICRELLSFCELLLLDLDYRITPAKELVENALKSDAIKHLGFVKSDSIVRKQKVESLLSKEENERISEFMFSFGKSDVNTQKRLICNFKEYINSSMEKYSKKHKKDSKLYLSFGLFFGIVFSLIWS